MERQLVRKTSRLTWVNAAFLVLQGAIGGYLLLVPDRTTFLASQILVLVHVATCLLWLPFFVWWVLKHTWAPLVAKRLRGVFTSANGLLGVTLLVVVLFGFGSGFPLLNKGAGMPVAWFHAISGMLVLLPFGLHLWFEHKKLLLISVVALSLAGVASILTVKESVAGDTEKPAAPKFAYRDQPLELYDNAAWCGSCHDEVYREWSNSTHRRTINMDVVKESFVTEGGKSPGSTSISLAEWGKMIHGGPELNKNLPTDTPFLACAACHAPLGFYAKIGREAVNAPEPISDGISCSFCHTTRGFGGGSMNLTPLFVEFGKSKKLDNHELMKEVPFYVSGPQTVRRYLWQNDKNPVRRWIGDMLIRWRPEMHARDYHPDFLNTSLLCHGCHGFQGDTVGAPGRSFATWEHSTYNSKDQAKRTECQDCHMARSPDGHPVREKGKLVPWAPERAQRRYHYFLGGNVTSGKPADPDYIKAQRELRLKGIEFKAGNARVENNVLSLDVSLHNRMNAHYFPAFETRRRWAWVEIKVVDADGTLLAHSRPGPKKNTETPGCCKVGMDPIVYFRTLSEAGVIENDSLVRPDSTRTDVAKLALGANPAFPLKVTATLWHNCDDAPVASQQLIVP